jgi:hypothetical protein
MSKKLTGCFIIFGLAALGLLVAFVLAMRNYGDHVKSPPEIAETPSSLVIIWTTRAYTWIGSVVSLSIDVTSSIDEPYAEIKIVLPEGLKLEKGDLVWRGSLEAHKTKTLEVSVCALAERNYEIMAQAQVWWDKDYSEFKEDYHQAVDLNSINYPRGTSCP